MTTQSSKPISPLRQRMLDDMALRQLAPLTQKGYLRSVIKFTRFFGRSPDLATPEDLRAFQLHMVDQGDSPMTINSTLTGLKFFYEVTLDRPEALKKTSHVPLPERLPLVLSVEQVTRLLAAAPTLKARAALSVAYGAGLRSAEVVNLKVTDIDRERKVIRVEQGKGRRDRYAMLGPSLLQVLELWWRQGRASEQLLPGGWLFASRLDPVNPMSTRQLGRLCKQAAAAAELDKKVSMHTLRHSFATHLLERHVDIRIIQVLLGHQKLNNTARYSQVATTTLSEVTSPLDLLAVPID